MKIIDFKRKIVNYLIEQKLDSKFIKRAKKEIGMLNYSIYNAERQKLDHLKLLLEKYLCEEYKAKWKIKNLIWGNFKNYHWTTPLFNIVGINYEG